MIVLVPRCGLRNQMFEYAYARHLMQKLGEKSIYMDYRNTPKKKMDASIN